MNIGDLKHGAAIGLGVLSIAFATALPASADAAQHPAQPGSAQQGNGSLRPMQRFTDLLASAASQSSERSAETGRDADDPVARDPPPQLNETVPPPAEQVEERAMQPVKPPPVTIKALAASPERGTFAQLDGDGDGRVSAAEAQASAEFQADFKALDVDADGYLSQGEFRDGDSGERNDRAEDLEERDDGP